MTEEQQRNLVSSLMTAAIIVENCSTREPNAGTKQRLYDMAQRWRQQVADLHLDPDAGELMGMLL